MEKKLHKAEKAYTNLDFLKSADARIVRVLAEFLEPRQRFRLHKIADTIVFFGSSRTQSLEDAQKYLREIEEEIKNNNSPELQEKHELARNEVFMSQYYDDAVELARRITEWSKTLNRVNRFVVCSGGGPGLMEAANKGALSAGGKSIGLNISIPTEQYPNQFISPELNFEFHYFFIRKFWFVYLAKALVIFPGGFGTMDELFEVLTLIQTDKVKKPMPIVIYGSDYWNEVINFDAMVKYGTISKADLKLFRSCDTVDEAFEYLKEELTKHYLNVEVSVENSVE